MYQITITCEEENELAKIARMNEAYTFISEFAEILRCYQTHQSYPNHIKTADEMLEFIREEFISNLKSYKLMDVVEI